LHRTSLDIDGAIIGGDDWMAVRRYLNSRAQKPTSVEGWIGAAEAVRDKSRQPPPARRTHARH
jgi:hypothetical protein